MSYGAFGILYHPETRQVLLNRRGVDAPKNPDTWGLFGGGAEIDDRGDPLATWCREVREELGIALDPAKVAPLTAYPGTAGHLRHVFCYAWPALDTQFVLGEGAGFAWFTLAEALALPDLTDMARRDLQMLQRWLGPAASAT
jgi:8-oxo-dGTP pyrophosphatase MutT (NUDIX family)